MVVECSYRNEPTITSTMFRTDFGLFPAFTIVLRPAMLDIR